MRRLIHKAPLFFFSTPVALAAGLVVHFALAAGASQPAAVQALANSAENQIALAPVPALDARPIIPVEVPTPAPQATVDPEAPKQLAPAREVIAPEPLPQPVIAALPELAPHITIKPGSNLWALSRELYGAGRYYEFLFQANKGLIQDPRLIYPGQVLAAPKHMDN